jgi:hypothetical protein
MPTLTAKQKRQEREDLLRAEGAAQARAEMMSQPQSRANEAPTPEQIQELNMRAFADPSSVPIANSTVAKPKSGGAKVIVACKLAVTSYAIQLCKIEDKFEQNLQGGRMVKEATRIGEVVILRGTSYPRGTPPIGFPERPLMVGGAALNFGIDKEWFDEWLRQHHLDPIVKNKLIFAHENQDMVVGEARELASFQSGLEPIDPSSKNDRRIPRSTRDEVDNVTTERETKRRAAANVSSA